MKSKKGGFNSRLFLRKLLNIILIAFISICLWEMLQKQLSYNKNAASYKQIQQKKQNSNNINEFLSKYNCDWITVSNTVIDYPLMTYTDNDYYMYHDYKGEDDIGGAIFYDCYDEPNNGTLSIIYGHSMRNGSMFNNLHIFQKDHSKFESSILTITTQEGETRYKPLGYYVTLDDFFYRNLDDKFTTEAVDIIEKKSDYFIRNTEVKEGAHIMALYTCDYSKGNGRLIVFYIEEVN